MLRLFFLLYITFCFTLSSIKRPERAERHKRTERAKRLKCRAGFARLNGITMHESA